MKKILFIFSLLSVGLTQASRLDKTTFVLKEDGSCNVKWFEGVLDQVSNAEGLKDKIQGCMGGRTATDIDLSELNFEDATHEDLAYLNKLAQLKGLKISL